MNHLKVVSDRQTVYGHPLDQFTRMDLIKRAVAHCQDPAVRHALEMIGVKLVRLADTPDHQDSITDIAGYAETINMIWEKRREQGSD